MHCCSQEITYTADLTTKIRYVSMSFRLGFEMFWFCSKHIPRVNGFFCVHVDFLFSHDRLTSNKYIYILSWPCQGMFGWFFLLVLLFHNVNRTVIRLAFVALHDRMSNVK